MKSSNEKLAIWLKENSSLLNMSAISKEAGIDRSNFNKYLDGLKIPDKHIPKLKELIKRLEFKDELYLNQPKEKTSVKYFAKPISEIKPEKTLTTEFKPEQNLYQTYLSEINSATSIESIEITMSAVKIDKKLTYAEKRVIEQLAKQKSKQFDF